MYKSSITLKLLELARDMAGGSVDLMKSFLTSGYGASYGKLMYNFQKNQSQRYGREQNKRLRQRYYSLLARLKKDGLVEKNAKGSIRLTHKGTNTLNKLMSYRSAQPDISLYTKEPAEYFVIVAFDIPENERRKRSWLRAALKNLGLKMVQKSFWMGKVKLPEEFINDVHKLRISDYVEIFQVTKSGSLTHVV